MTIQNLYPTIAPSLSLDFANVGALDPRITFVRTTTATYYGTETAKAEENLFTNSQAIGSYSSTGILTKTNNAATAPDGTTTAASIIENTGTSEHFLSAPTVAFVSGLEYSLSCFVKLNGRNFFRLSFSSTAFPLDERFAFFDVQNGVLGTVALNITAVITDAGNGWYRCSISRAATANTNAGTAFLVLAAVDNETNYTGDGTSGLFLWGAQLEQRDAATAYTPTTTQPITNYIPVLETAASGVARFDHNPVTKESLGLLIEEQRTNLLLRSEEFDNAGWDKTNATVIANQVIAPDGTLAGDVLVPNGSSSSLHRVGVTFTVVTGTVYTFSAYVKAGGYGFLGIQQSASGGAGIAERYSIINLSTGALVSETVTGSTSVISVGNGWYRVSLTTSATTGGGTPAFRLVALNTGSTSAFEGDGFSGIFLWGAQLEIGAFATSYIQTVAATVTRNADAASMTGTNFSSWYNAAAGTLYSDAITLAPISIARAFASINDNSANNRWTISVADVGGSPVIRPLRNTSGAGLLVTPTAGTANTTQAGNKVALAITNYEVSMCSNGNAAVTVTTAYLIPVVTQMQIGNQLAGSLLNGHLRKLSYYPQKLTNAQLQALTT